MLMLLLLRLPPKRRLLRLLLLRLRWRGPRASRTSSRCGIHILIPAVHSFSNPLLLILKYFASSRCAWTSWSAWSPTSRPRT